MKLSFKQCFYWVLPSLLASNALANFTPSPLIEQLKQGSLAIQAGGFNVYQGQAQNVQIATLIGDHFSVSNKHNQNALIGLGYFFNGQQYNNVSLMYGLNAFYFFKTTVSGTVKQEQLFNNLSYSYDVNHLPIYFAGKALFKTRSEKFNIVLDAGVGPNIYQTSHFGEGSLDGGVTIPDRAFSGATQAAFSAMGGVGVRINNLIANVPLECGYRIFYLGQTTLRTENSQILTPLSTGDSYAQALTCGISV